MNTELITVIAKLMGKVQVYTIKDSEIVLAVPLKQLTEVLEQLTTTQTLPPLHDPVYPEALMSKSKEQRNLAK